MRHLPPITLSYRWNPDIVLRQYSCLLTVLYINVVVVSCVPGSLTLREARAALWNVRAEWRDLGIVLCLPHETLEVIGRIFYDVTRYFQSILNLNLTNLPLSLDFKTLIYCLSILTVFTWLNTHLCRAHVNARVYRAWYCWWSWSSTWNQLHARMAA